MAIAQGEIILASDFNNIRDRVVSVLGKNSTGYGSDLKSQPVYSGNIIYAQNFNDLFYDIQRCVIHQTGIGVLITTPISGQPVYASELTALSLLADEILTNKTAVDSTQTATDSQNGLSIRQGNWGTTALVHTVEHTWLNGADAGYFFNLGGKLKVTLAYGNSSGSQFDLDWIALIDSINADLVSGVYNLFRYQAGVDYVIYKISGNNFIEVRFVKVSDQKIRTIVTFEPTGDDSVDLDVSSEVSYVYSLGSAGPGPYGIAAPRPQVETTTTLLDGGPGIPIFVESRILEPNPRSITFTDFKAQSNSNTVNVLLTNLGNSDLTITGFQYNLPTNMSVNISGISFPQVIAPLSSITLGIYFGSYGVAVGNYSGSLVIVSDADLGNTIIDFNYNITPAQFDFSLNYNSWTIDPVTEINTFERTFVITPINGSFSDYNVSFTDLTGISFLQTLQGPRVFFSSLGLVNGQYSTILTITVNGVSKQIPILMTVNLLQQFHIGDWMSARMPSNCTVGMSYDILNGERYLTIGVLGGADGSDQFQSVDNYPWLSVSNLGVNADNKSDEGVAMFIAPDNAAYSAHLNIYGVWIRSPDTKTVVGNSNYGPVGPTGVEITRSWKFTVPTTDNYRVEFNVDNRGYLAIDGSILLDRRADTSFEFNSWTITQLTAGEHEITLVFQNDYQYLGIFSSGSNPAAVSAEILKPDNSETFWSTVQPVRNNTPYLYWNEVYRIKLDRGAHIYYSRDHIVKNSGRLSGRSIGDWFGTGGTNSAGSLFTITDDGSGNLSIVMNPNTVTVNDYDLGFFNDVRTLPYAFYYHVKNSTTSLARFTNLEPLQNDGLTRFFLGFSSNGAVLTSRVLTPTMPDNPYASGEIGGDNYADLQYDGGGPPVF